MPKFRITSQLELRPVRILVILAGRDFTGNSAYVLRTIQGNACKLQLHFVEILELFLLFSKKLQWKRSIPGQWDTCMYLFLPELCLTMTGRGTAVCRAKA